MVSVTASTKFKPFFHLNLLLNEMQCNAIYLLYVVILPICVIKTLETAEKML